MISKSENPGTRSALSICTMNEAGQNEFETGETTKVETASFDARASFQAMRALQSSGLSVHEAYRIVTRLDGFHN